MKISKMIYSLCAVSGVFCLNAHAEGSRGGAPRWDTNAVSGQRVMMGAEPRPGFSSGAPDFQANRAAAGQGFSGQYVGGQDLDSDRYYVPDVWPPFAAYNNGQYADFTGSSRWELGAVSPYQGVYLADGDRLYAPAGTFQDQLSYAPGAEFPVGSSARQSVAVGIYPGASLGTGYGQDDRIDLTLDPSVYGFTGYGGQDSQPAYPPASQGGFYLMDIE